MPLSESPTRSPAPADRLSSVDKRMRMTALGVIALCFSSPACRTWFVKAPEAPFPYHMFVFNSDGTMQQANPDAGDPNTSDSNGMGVWIPDNDRIKGKFVEVTANRMTHHFVSRGEISFSIEVNGNTFSSVASAFFYDAEGRRLRGPVAATLKGRRDVP